ncbi:ABC transporter ATP-binding protein [Kosmotoga sp. DU53]|uniref:ABC transporter ATP-binding protein n=1 Tax=Kosmotoga sp. DU53 TaxID=1310160 RepID=UPI0007C43128|nr:ABC transporter ATP-binding protein [Kosmotoga sp. DU53]
MQIKMEGIVKKFGSVVANSQVDFDVLPGEVHSLLGENGAGKTTLMKILYGIHIPDEGKIFINGEESFIQSPRVALEKGIGMVQQHFSLVPSFSVFENVILGLKSREKLDKLRRAIEEIIERFHLGLDLDAKIWQLSHGEKQKVEILKFLYRDVDLLILDEPTSALAPSEVYSLFDIIRELKSTGKSVVFITHKLEEVFTVSDRITILRKGKKIATVDATSVSPQEVVKMMVGEYTIIEKFPKNIGKEILRVRNFTVIGDRGTPAVRNVSFDLRAGEILGIAGVEGNGQRELAEGLYGLRTYDGEIFLHGNHVRINSPQKALSYGIGYIPEDRFVTGLIPDLSVSENIVLKSISGTPFSSKGIINREKVRNFSEKVVKKYRVSLPSIWAPIKKLSGGNAQKVLAGRELEAPLNLLIAVNPTNGLDVASTEHIHKLLLKTSQNGIPVLLISTDLEEIYKISDIIVVMYKGKLTKRIEALPENQELIGQLMAGVNFEKYL